MYFVALTVILQPRDRRRLSVADGVYAHAAVFNAITRLDQGIGEALHEMNRHKRIALALIDLQHQTALRISFMADEGITYAHLLMQWFTKHNVLQIGPTLCDITHVGIDQNLWSGIATWADMSIPAQAGGRIFLNFATPTAIAKIDGHGKRFFSLFPDVVDVFSGLAYRWKSLNGPALPDDLNDFLRLGGCITTSHQIQTVAFRTRERLQIGFVGSVSYECRSANTAYLGALHGLARMAFFTGVGYQTTRGMGLTHTTIKD